MPLYKIRNHDSYYGSYTGNNTCPTTSMLFLIDSIYGCRLVNGIPGPKWQTQPFNGDGKRLKSLGTAEHWNNQHDRQYSRNLGTGDGIELIYKKVEFCE